MKTINFSSPKTLRSVLVPLTLAILSFSMAQAKADILINEVDADQSSTDSAEFIELYDGGVGSSDLSGLSLVLYNGSNDASYRAYDLDGLSTNADGYFVLCGDAANTTNCDLDVSPNTNLIQNGADAVALVTGDAVNYPNGTPISTNNLLDALVYDTSDGDDAGLLVLLNPGQSQINEGGSGDQTGHSNQRCENGSGGARNTDTYEQHSPTPGTENICGGDIIELGLCADPATYIHDVQGNGFTSPLAGTSGVNIEGIVTADFQGSEQLGGFYMQEEDADADADAGTSEGIFVHNASNVVSVGDVVRIQGSVTEFFGLTELNNVTGFALCDTGKSVSESLLTLPVTSLSEFEQFEGMLVSISQPLTVNDNFSLGRFGEVVLSDRRTFQYTHANLPDVAGYAAHQASLALNQITLDDANSNQNIDPTFFPAPGLSASNTLRSGSLTTVEGVITYAFRRYRIQPTEEVVFSTDNLRLESAPAVGGDLKIASFNVLNYFTTLDTGEAICGANANLSCRGADSAEEFTRQRDKIIQAIKGIDADILGLVEVENNASVAIADLVEGLNSVMGAGTYAYVDTGTIGTDAIKVGFIYKPSNIDLINDFAILDSSVDPQFIDDKNRPSLAQTFAAKNGETFTIAVNHFKSKGSNCKSLGDANKNDGQGNCSETRANASQALVNWLATDPTQSNDADFLIIGDLNAYAMEDAVTRLTDNGFTNLIDDFIGLPAYSYVFRGEAGYLDHALASPELTSKVTGVAEWHINADEPTSLDYNEEFKSDAQVISLYNSDSYRSSDHDPIIIGLDMNAAPSCELAQPSVAQLWSPNHKFMPISILGVTDVDDDEISVSIDSIFQDEAVNTKGSGKAGVDGRGVGTDTAEIRAERSGDGNGRFYHIAFTANDGNGGSCTNTVQVNVPNNKGKKSVSIDGGAVFDSTIE
jgi:predicted extracellular nuclease